MRHRTLRLALLCASCLVAGAAVAQTAPPQAQTRDSLAEGFSAPPESAHPRVWWHWLSGNVSQEGITKDLEWMQRIGIAGAMMFDGDMGAPKIVPERVTVLSPAWYANLRFAAAEADRLGLEFAMAAAPGWSETGGPWVKPEAGMKKFVWSETRVAGGQRAGKIAPLPSNAGPFQAMAKHDFTGKAQEGGPTLARDVAVLAFRAPQGETPLAAFKPVVTTNASGIDAAKLIDGDVDHPVLLPTAPVGTAQWVRYDFAAPSVSRAKANSSAP